MKVASFVYIAQFSANPMKWYFCFNQRVSGWLGEMIKVCVKSNSLFAHLEPHCIYDGEKSALTDWLENNGVTVHFRRVSFFDELKSPEILAANADTAYDADAAAGFYLLLEIANVENSDEYVLFTDIDVFFQKMPDILSTKPASIAACGEVNSVTQKCPGPITGSFNSGVIVFNTQALKNDYEAIVDVARKGAFFSGEHRGTTYDQWVLNEFYRDRWDKMSDNVNWRAFWEHNDDAEIIHFHGPKPVQIEKFLSNREHVEGLTGDILNNNEECYVLWLEKYNKIRQTLKN